MAHQLGPVVEMPWEQQALDGIGAMSLDRRHVFDALANRRAYGSTNARILLDFRVAGHMMGEVVKDADGARTITARVVSREPLSQVVVFKNGSILVEKKATSASPLGMDLDIQVEDARPERETDWYYLRAIQMDEQIAWSSPVWVIGQ